MLTVLLAQIPSSLGIVLMIPAALYGVGAWLSETADTHDTDTTS